LLKELAIQNVKNKRFSRWCCWHFSWFPFWFPRPAYPPEFSESKFRPRWPPCLQTNPILKGNDHEVEFHEIEIHLFHETEFLIMRSKFYLFMRSNLSNNIDQEVDTSIMRSKPKQALFLISISWLFLWLTNRSWDWNSKRSIIREFWSHDRFVSRMCDHEIECFYAQMANN